MVNKDNMTSLHITVLQNISYMGKHDTDTLYNISKYSSMYLNVIKYISSKPWDVMQGHLQSKDSANKFSKGLTKQNVKG